MCKTTIVATFVFLVGSIFIVHWPFFFGNIAQSTLYIYIYILLLVNTINCHNIFTIIKILMPYRSK